jgi:hypothetical protein
MVMGQMRRPQARRTVATEGPGGSSFPLGPHPPSSLRAAPRAFLNRIWRGHSFMGLFL